MVFSTEVWLPSIKSLLKLLLYDGSKRVNTSETISHQYSPTPPTEMSCIALKEQCQVNKKKF